MSRKTTKKSVTRIFSAIGILSLFLIMLFFEIYTPQFLLGIQASAGENIIGYLNGQKVGEVPVASQAAVKRYTLIAQEVQWEIAPGQFFMAFTYNGTIPGPTLVANVGDTIIVTLVNKLRTIVSAHTHGLTFNYTSDGSFTSKAFAPPGGTYTYTWVAKTDSIGTWAYHDSVAKLEENPPSFFRQHPNPESGEGIERGLYGAMIVKGINEPRVDHEVVLIGGEFGPEPTNGRYFDIWNGHSFGLTPHFIFKQGEKIRFHVINIGPNEVHTLHIHGQRWIDPQTGQVIDNKFLPLPSYVATTLVKEKAEGTQGMFGVMEFYDFIVVARDPGDWLYHCHVYDHIANGETGTFTVLPAS